MGNMQCPAEDAALLASVARDICPFPNYNPSAHYIDMLSINSSKHLRDHYETVQTSLTQEQLEEFTQGLRTTFGREGKVTLGGVGVVALSLAILFDTLAKQVKGEFVLGSGPIPNLFLKNPGGFYAPRVSIVSDYLRLVPYIANNPQRMREEIERYLKLMKNDEENNQASRRSDPGDITGVNEAVSNLIHEHIRNHLVRITNSTYLKELVSNRRRKTEIKTTAVTQGNLTESGAETADVVKSRKRRIPPPDRFTVFNLNCDPETTDKIFLNEVMKFNATHEAYERCGRRSEFSRSWLHHSAGLVWMDFVNSEVFDLKRYQDALRAQRDDFDLKANALLKWKQSPIVQTDNDM
ncbi:unnamed protein product [Ophioblennius macclurei]